MSRHMTNSKRIVKRSPIRRSAAAILAACVFFVAPVAVDAQELTDDQGVLAGELDNRFSYFIRENEEPSDRAVLRLVVNVGSVVEEEDELGLAHFVEHMAFRGTENYTREEIIGFLEEVGMQYGPHVNAYVGFDETVYMLRVPTDEDNVLKRGLSIMGDWAHQMGFDEEHIEHERGVIEEEWRARLGSAQRVRDEQLPVILHESRYAERLPIGDLDIVRGAPPERIEGFYDTWYRPELMAVVAVGDFDAEEVRAQIADIFGDIPASEAPVSRPAYEVPEHDETLYAIVEDPELRSSSVAIYNKEPFEPVETVEDFRSALVQRLYEQAMNRRFERIEREADAPFIRASAGVTHLARPMVSRFLWGVVDEAKEEAVEEAGEALITETRRVAEHGFTEREIQQARDTVLREVEREFRRRDQIPSEEHAERYIEAFLEGQAFPSAETRYELAREMLPEIEPPELQDVAEAYLGEENRVVTVSQIEREDRRPPTEEELAAVFDDAALVDVEPYEVEIGAEEFEVMLPEPGEIVEETYREELELYEWELSNGATVLVRPSDFRSDEVLFNAYALGGKTLVDEENLVNAEFVSDLVYESGAGGYSRSDLEDLLSGLDVELAPYIERIEHGFTGTSGEEEIEELMQLVALFFGEPREDEGAFDRVFRRKRTEVQNQEADPGFQFSQKITGLLWDENPRVMPVTTDDLDGFDMEGAYELFADLFSNPGEFTFTIVGDVEIDRVRSLVEEYIAAVPGEPAESEAIDHGHRHEDGAKTGTVRSGVAPQSFVAFLFHGEHEYDREENYLVSALGEVLHRRMNEYLREALGAVYSSGAIGVTHKYPWERYAVQLQIATDPEEAEALGELTLEELERIRAGELDESYIRRTREVQRSNYEEGLESNEFWLRNLKSLNMTGRDYRELLEYEQLVDDLSMDDMVRMAGKLLDMERYVHVTLLPGEDS